MFLWMPLSVFGLNGSAIRVRIATEAATDDEPEDDGEEYTPGAEEEAGAGAPAKKKRQLSCAQVARNLFQHADVKHILRAVLGDKMQAANEAACAAVEMAERAEAEARIQKAQGIVHDKKRSREMARAEKNLERVRREPKPMPPPEAGPGEASEKLSQVLSQLGGNLWQMTRRNMEGLENGEEALSAMVEAAKERPAALLESDAFKEAFRAATGEEMPVLQFAPCTGCHSLGCRQCRVIAV